MRILKNRISKSFRGRGKDGVDINYSLLSPPSGNFLQSTDFVKSLDLVCEGEIEGFVNNDGEKVNGINVLEAINLDDIPISKRSNNGEVSYNFQNIAVNYRLGSEIQSPIDGFNKPTKQKEVNFALLGKHIYGSDLGLEKAVATPLFEEYDEQIFTGEEGTYTGFNTETTQYIETRKFLRLTGLNITNIGVGYTEDSPVEIAFSNLGDPRVSGGDGTIYDIPSLTIITDTVNEGGILSYTIDDSGRFEGSYSIEIYSGEYKESVVSGSGTLYNFPTSSFEYGSGLYTGTGIIEYFKNNDGVEIYPTGTGTTGTYSGYIGEGSGADPDVFAGAFIGPHETIQIAFEGGFSSTQDFSFTGTGQYFEKDSPTPFFEEAGVEPTYIVNFSDPENFISQGDVRNGIDYSSWNNTPSEPTDRQSYTHIVQNSNVDSVSAIIDIKRLNDTEHKATNEVVLTEKPTLFGGGKADVAFRIGNPTDSFVKIKIEWGFLNTDLISSSIETYEGQTINGYLVETTEFIFNSYKTLQESAPEYSNLTIKQLKTAYPKFIRVSKNMYETDSALINRNVLLHSIKEHFDTELIYPSSALVATKINSTYFDNIPKRTYNLKLKKVWVPETYNIKHKNEDKRFRKSEINKNSEIDIVSEKLVWNRFSLISPLNDNFGYMVTISNNDLFVADSEWGNQNAFPYSNYGNIFIFNNLAKKIDPIHPNFEIENDFIMVRDGIPRNTRLSDISPGWFKDSEGDRILLPDFDIINGNLFGGVNISTLNSSVYVYKEVVTALIGYINIDTIYAGSPMSATHSLFMRISPKKTATLRATIYFDVPNGDYSYLAKQACGVVVGGVRNPYSTTPDFVYKTINHSNEGNQVITIENSSETDYLYVKFFSAEFRSIIIKRIDTDYGIIEYPDLAQAHPPYYAGGLHPDSISVSSVSLTDEDMKDYFFFSEHSELECNGKYLVSQALLNAEALENPFNSNTDCLLVLKKDDNGFWYKHQTIIYLTSDGYDKEAFSVSFFPSQDRFAVVWDTTSDNTKHVIEIYSLNSQGMFVLESSFSDFLGVFEGYEVYSLNKYFKGFCVTPDKNTIILSRNCTVREINRTDDSEIFDQDDEILYNVFVYKLNNNNWSLSEIVFPPEYKYSMSSNTGPKIDVAGPWLIIGGRYYDNGPVANRDVGVVLLYRYNGKKYEYIRKFLSDRVDDLYENGDPDITNYRTNFGEEIKIGLNDNNEPVIVVACRDDQSDLDPNKDEAIYIFENRPHENSWSKKRYELGSEFLRSDDYSTQTFDELNFADNTEYGKHLDFDGKNIAFSLPNAAVQNFDSFPDSVGLITLSSPEKSTRLYEENTWFGVMKKDWSDNPAWIIYDLLTNPIYGAGAALDDLKDINVFNFYEVSKYFDSCNEEGYYIPLYDEKGQTEPRLSCNFLLDEDYNAFEVISAICDLFFGAVYIKEGKYNIWADRPARPSWYFNNNDVLDGDFSYRDSSKNERPSVIKVPFLDKYEDFQEKIEFIEDPVLMRKNGKIEKELDFVAFTTRSQARRFGKQYLYNKSYETEKVTFQTDDRALFLNPGDVIGINDELKTFENEKLFWNTTEINHKEKIYAVQHAKSAELNDTFLFSEIIISNGDTDNFEVNYIEQESSNGQDFRGFNIQTDNSGIPYILGIFDGSSAVYKKTGNAFQEVIFEEGSFYSGTDDFLSNLEFDSSNKPYFSIIEGGNSEPAIGFIKFTGTDFENTGHWQKVSIEALDSVGSGWRPTTNFTSVIKIADNDEKYILTYRFDSSPSSGEYILYHYDGIGNDSDPSSWDRHLLNSYQKNDPDYHFDMELINNKPAIAYTSHVTGLFNDLQIRYKEFTGSNLGSPSDWGDVFVAERSSSYDRDVFSLNFDRNLIPIISHSKEEDNSYRIYSSLSYSHRFDATNWISNNLFVDYRPSDYLSFNYSTLTAEHLQDERILLFNRSYESGDKKLRSLQFYELSSPTDWFKPQNFTEKTVFRTDPEDLIEETRFLTPSIPSTTYNFNGCTITLNNSDSFLFEDGFSLDTSISNNLEIINFSNLEISGLYNQTKFEGTSIKVREDVKIESEFVTVTGYNTSGNFINLFLEQTPENTRSIKNLKTTTPLVRPVRKIEKYKEYRVLNITEKDANLYEIEGKEYHSGKFDIIDNFGSMQEPIEPEYNIGLPTNIINRPPEPLGVSYQTGIDDGGSPFLTGQITGEINGDEQEYRLSVRYPNGRFTNKEIEKNTNNLSPSGNPLTDFGFYNLSTVGDYELTVKSLRNPESSEFINTSFTINQTKDKISTYPFLEELGLSTSLETVKVKVRPKNVYGDPLNLSESLCRIKIKIDGETWINDSKLTDFETSFQEIKDLTNNSNREKEFEAELIINGEAVSQVSKTLFDEPPKINNAEFVSDGSVANLLVDISENEKLRYIDLKTGNDIIKTFTSENQNQIQFLKLEDFEINSLPKKQKITFSLAPRDFYGTGDSYEVEGFIPEKESVFEKYTNSILPIYSIYSSGEISNWFSDYNSSNGQTGFYGNGESCLFEFSSSLISGSQANLNLEISSEEETKSVSLNFNDQGFMSTKKILKLSKKYYNIDISGQNGLFDGFELKIKKLV